MEGLWFFPSSCSSCNVFFVNKKEEETVPQQLGNFLYSSSFYFHEFCTVYEFFSLKKESLAIILELDEEFVTLITKVLIFKIRISFQLSFNWLYVWKIFLIYSLIKRYNGKCFIHFCFKIFLVLISWKLLQVIVWCITMFQFHF